MDALKGICKSRAMCALRASVVCVSTFPCGNVSKRFKSVPISHFCVPTCQRAKRCAKFSTWRANFSIWLVNVPKCKPFFSTSPAKRCANFSTIFQKNISFYIPNIFIPNIFCII